MRLPSYRIRKSAKRHDVSYSFLFMKASGDQLRALGSLVYAGAISPIIEEPNVHDQTKMSAAGNGIRYSRLPRHVRWALAHHRGASFTWNRIGERWA